MKKILAAAAFAATMVVGSSASAAVVFTTGTPTSSNPAASVDLTVNTVENIVGSLVAGALVSFEFTVLELLTVTGISFSGTGPTAPGSRDPLEDVLFGFTTTPTTSFAAIQSVGASSAALGFLPVTGVPGGPDMNVGDVFNIFVLNNSAAKIGLTNTVTTGDVTPIPVPAAMPLLAGGIASLVLFRKKKRS